MYECDLNDFDYKKGENKEKMLFFVKFARENVFLYVKKCFLEKGKIKTKKKGVEGKCCERCCWYCILESIECVRLKPGSLDVVLWEN